MWEVKVALRRADLRHMENSQRTLRWVSDVEIMLFVACN